MAVLMTSKPSGRYKVLILAPAPEMKGGVAAAARNLAAGINDPRLDLQFFPSTREGTIGQRVRFSLKQVWRWTYYALPAADLVHIHSSWRNSFFRKSLFALAAYLRGVPVVYHIHPHLFLDFFDRAPWLVKRYIEFILKKADRVVVLSNLMAKALSEKIPGLELRVIPNAVVWEPFANLDCRRQDQTLLYLGSLEPVKGVQDLAPLAARLVKTGARFRFIICGDHGLKKLKEQIDQAGLSSYFDLRGWVGEPEKLQVLATATAMIIPSYSEGVPIALLEGMAAGIPIITTPVGSIPEIVSDGQEALFAPPGDLAAMEQAVLKIFSDKKLAKALGEKARARVCAEFTAKRVAARLTQIYLEALKEKA